MALFQSMDLTSSENNCHSMEKMSSTSWGWGRPQSLQNSQWLQTHLSELEKKIEAMLGLIEVDADSSAKKVEMYYRRRPKLKQMVEDFNRAYQRLAKKYDQLLSESTQINSSEFSSSSSNSTEVRHVSKNVVRFDFCRTKVSHLLTESNVEDPGVEHDNINLEFDRLDSDRKLQNTDGMNGIITDFSDEGGANRKMDDFKLSIIAIGHSPASSLEQENTWSELRFQVMKLTEENLQQQAELIRRNDEKGEIIKELQIQLKQLKSENRALKSCLRCTKVDIKHNQSPIPKLKGVILIKFFR